MGSDWAIVTLRRAKFGERNWRAKKKIGERKLTIMMILLERNKLIEFEKTPKIGDRGLARHGRPNFEACTQLMRFKHL